MAEDPKDNKEPEKHRRPITGLCATMRSAVARKNRTLADIKKDIEEGRIVWPHQKKKPADEPES